MLTPSLGYAATGRDLRWSFGNRTTIWRRCASNPGSRVFWLGPTHTNLQHDAHPGDLLIACTVPHGINTPPVASLLHAEGDHFESMTFWMPVQRRDES